MAAHSEPSIPDWAGALAAVLGFLAIPVTATVRLFQRTQDHAGRIESLERSNADKLTSIHRIEIDIAEIKTLLTRKLT